MPAGRPPRLPATETLVQLTEGGWLQKQIAAFFAVTTRALRKVKYTPDQRARISSARRRCRDHGGAFNLAAVLVLPAEGSDHDRAELSDVVPRDRLEQRDL